MSVSQDKRARRDTAGDDIEEIAPGGVTPSGPGGQHQSSGDDAELLRALHEEHASALWGFVLHLTGGDRNRAEDVVQSLEEAGQFRRKEKDAPQAENHRRNHRE